MFCQICYLLEQLSLFEKCPYSEFLWCVFWRNLSLVIQSEPSKIRTRKTPNTDTFYTVYTLGLYSSAAFLVDNPYNTYPQGQKLQSNIYSQIKHRFSISYDFAVLWNPFLPKTVLFKN